MVFFPLFLVLLGALTCSAALSKDDRLDDDDAVHVTHEADIIHDLLHHRGDISHGPPPSGSALKVETTVLVNSVSKVRMEEGAVDFVAIIICKWVDPRLRFQYSQPFHPVKRVNLEADKIWTPDMKLYDSAGPGPRALIPPSYAEVQYDGQIQLWDNAILPVLCDVSALHNNKSASVTCQIRIGSWRYRIEQLDLLSGNKQWPVLSLYKATGQWLVTNASAERVERPYPGTGSTFVEQIATVTFSRNVVD